MPITSRNRINVASVSSAPSEMGTNRWSEWQEEYSDFKEKALRIGDPKVAAE